MDHRAIVKLGRTGLNVTALGFGATAIGGMYEEVSDDQAHDTVDAAWEQGIRLFDAAPQYGLGLGEMRLGAGLAGRPRDEYVLSTKVGRLLRADAPPNPDDFGPDGQPFDKGTPPVRTVYDYSRDGVLASLAESLQRHASSQLRRRREPRRAAGLHRGEPAAARARPAGHRLRARPGQSSGRGSRRGLSGPDRTPPARGHQRGRGRHEPDGRPGDIRPGNRS